MKGKSLHPNQIITLRDYPLHNEQILEIYFRVFQRKHGNILPPCPVIHKSTGIPYSNKNDMKSKKYNSILRKFLEDNPNAEYFLLDGGHKSTAATLVHQLIPAIIIENEADFKKIHDLISSGEIFGWYDIGNSIQNVISKLLEHHFNTKKFQTIEDKVKLMIQDNNIPKYMAKIYRK